MSATEDDRCGLCGTTDFTHPLVRSVRCVYRCKRCGTIQCEGCTEKRPDPRGGSRGHCGRCGSDHVVDIAVFPDPFG